jgi:hypothetical protein
MDQSLHVDRVKKAVADAEWMVEPSPRDLGLTVNAKHTSVLMDISCFSSNIPVRPQTNNLCRFNGAARGTFYHLHLARRFLKIFQASRHDEQAAMFKPLSSSLFTL